MYKDAYTKYQDDLRMSKTKHNEQDEKFKAEQLKYNQKIENLKNLFESKNTESIVAYIEMVVIA